MSTSLSPSATSSVAELRATANVAMMLPSNIVGGVETATLRLALGLRDRGEFNPIAFVEEAEGPVGQLFAGEGFRVVPYQRQGPSYFHPAPYWRSIRDLRRQFIAHSIDLIHCADMHPGLQAPLAGKLAGIPSLVHIRSNFGNFLSRYKLPLACADHFAFASQACWRNFDGIWKVRGNGHVLYDWMPEQPRKCGRSEVRRMFSIPEDAFVIGMVARIAPPKDHSTLLKACAKLSEDGSRVRILFVGEAPSDDRNRELRSEIAALGLTERTTITGYRTDIPDLMAAMDVHVLCTKRESFGLVVLEAMTAGVPVVATRVGGIPEIVDHGETGLLHESGDSVELCRTLSALERDPSLRAKLVHNAAASIRRRFAKDAALDKVEALYRSLTSR